MHSGLVKPRGKRRSETVKEKRAKNTQKTSTKIFVLQPVVSQQIGYFIYLSLWDVFTRQLTNRKDKDHYHFWQWRHQWA